MAADRLIEGLVRLVSRVGSYTDAGALCGVARDLVRELGCAGAAVWLEQRGELVRECEEGLAIGDALARSVEGEVREEGDCIAWPLAVAGRSFGVLAVRGALEEPARMLVRMLAGRCAHILDDARKARMQRALLEGLSHELRAPLQALLGYADVLRGGGFGPLNDAQAEAVEAVAASAEKVLAVARDVLQVARIDAGHERPIVGEVALCDLLRREVDDARPLAEARGLRLSLDCPKDLVVVSDGAKMGRIVTNLLGNAIKYTREGGVSVAAHRLGEGCVIDVSDTGIGIPEERREAVFDEYVRLDPATEGTGLGLPIARRLAALLGGTLVLAPGTGAGSGPQRGSIFRLTLPPCQAC